MTWTDVVDDLGPCDACDEMPGAFYVSDWDAWLCESCAIETGQPRDEWCEHPALEFAC